MFCEKTGKSLLTDIGGRVVDMFLLNEPMEKSLKAADNSFRQQKNAQSSRRWHTCQSIVYII